MKKLKKLTAVLLCLAMLIAVCGTAAFATENKFYLVLGDSIGYASGLSNSQEACYGKIIADTNGYDYSNRAIPGHTTDNLISRLGEDEVIADVKKADIISISIGGNDFLEGGLVELIYDSMVKSDFSKFDEIADGFYSNLCKIIDLIESYNEDAIILMQTLYNPQSGYLRAPYQQGVNRLNAAIVRYGEEHPGRIVVIDIENALGDDMDNFALDTIHPSAQGNEIIASVIQAKLCELGLASSSELVITEKGQDIDVSPVFAIMINICGVFFHILGIIMGPFYRLISALTAFFGDIC